VTPATRQPASKVTVGQGASFGDLCHGPRAYDNSQRGAAQQSLRCVAE